MHIVGYFGIGLLATALGALPLGTVNLSVISTTLKSDAKQAMKIAFAAGIAEILLSLFALHCSTAFTQFITMHLWIQYTLAFVILAAGLFLFFKKAPSKSNTKNQKYTSKWATGFVLGLLNPPVIAYWILAISYIDMNTIPLHMKSPLFMLFIFFSGVYVGKVVTLFFYSKLSCYIKNRVQSVTQKTNKVLGIVLLLVGLIQLTKLLIP